MPILGEFLAYEIDCGTFSKIGVGEKNRPSLLITKLYQMSLEIDKEKYFLSKKSTIFVPLEK